MHTLDNYSGSNSTWHCGINTTRWSVIFKLEFRRQPVTLPSLSSIWTPEHIAPRASYSHFRGLKRAVERSLLLYNRRNDKETRDGPRRPKIMDFYADRWISQWIKKRDFHSGYENPNRSLSTNRYEICANSCDHDYLCAVCFLFIVLRIYSIPPAEPLKKSFIFTMFSDCLFFCYVKRNSKSL